MTDVKPTRSGCLQPKSEAVKPRSEEKIAGHFFYCENCGHANGGPSTSNNIDTDAGMLDFDSCVTPQKNPVKSRKRRNSAIHSELSPKQAPKSLKKFILPNQCKETNFDFRFSGSNFFFKFQTNN